MMRGLRKHGPDVGLCQPYCSSSCCSRRSSRESQRLLSISWSPVLTQLEHCLHGVTTLRAYGAQPTLTHLFVKATRDNNALAYVKGAMDQWLFVQVLIHTHTSSGKQEEDQY